MKLMAAAAAALAGAMFAGSPGQAQQPGGLRAAADGPSALHWVQERGDRGGDRDRSERRGDRDGRDGDRRRGGGFNLYIGPGVPGIYGGSPSGNCAWLRRRAVETGSNYWWNRYRRCRGWR